MRRALRPGRKLSAVMMSWHVYVCCSSCVCVCVLCLLSLVFTVCGLKLLVYET
jgi:hypothetical protein